MDWISAFAEMTTYLRHAQLDWASGKLVKSDMVFLGDGHGLDSRLHGKGAGLNVFTQSCFCAKRVDS